MKKIVFALAAVSLLIGPVSLANSAPKGDPGKAKCSASDIENHKALDEGSKAAKKAAEEAMRAAGKLRDKKFKVESDFKKANEGKSKRVKTLADLKAKQVNLEIRISELTNNLPNLAGKKLAGATKELAELQKELTKLAERIAKAQEDAAAATAIVDSVTIDVKQAVSDISVANQAATDAAIEAEKKAREFAKEQAKCRR